MEDRFNSQQQQQSELQISLKKIPLNLNFETFSSSSPLSVINSCCYYNSHHSNNIITFFKKDNGSVDGSINSGSSNNNSSGIIISNNNRNNSIMGNYNSTTIRGSSIIITSTTTDNNDNNNNLNGILDTTNDNLNNNNINNFSSQNLGLLVNASSVLNSSASTTLISNNFIGDDNNITRNNIISTTLATSLNANTTDSNGLIQKLSEKFGRGLSSNEVNMIRNQITLSGVGNSNGGHYQSHEDLLKQMEYDKFMNEIWIGIVLTLIVISLVFCICSCFLYHQFRQWKRNYRQNIQRNYDIESVKLNIEDDDPVPNYTLVSGLPSYEAALELLRNSSSSSSSTALLLPTTPAPPYPSPPSVFHVFGTNEKEESANSCEKLQSSSSSSSMITSATQVSSTILVTSTSTLPATDKTEQQQRELCSIPSYEEAIKSDSNVTATTATQTSIEKFVSNSSCDEVLLDTKLSS